MPEQRESQSFPSSSERESKLQELLAEHVELDSQLAQLATLHGGVKGMMLERPFSIEAANRLDTLTVEVEQLHKRRADLLGRQHDIELQVLRIRASEVASSRHLDSDSE